MFLLCVFAAAQALVLSPSLLSFACGGRDGTRARFMLPPVGGSVLRVAARNKSPLRVAARNKSPLRVAARNKSPFCRRASAKYA